MESQYSVLINRVGLILDLCAFWILIPLALGADRLQKLETFIVKIVSKYKQIFYRLDNQLSGEFSSDDSLLSNSPWKSFVYLLVIIISSILIILLVGVAKTIDININFFSLPLALIGILTFSLLLIYNFILLVMDIVINVSKFLTKILYKIINNFQLRNRLTFVGGLFFVLGFVLQLIATY